MATTVIAPPPQPVATEDRAPDRRGITVLLAVAGGLVPAKPGRTARVTAVSLILFGVFFLTHWDLRLPATFHYGWWPTMPWNA